MYFIDKQCVQLPSSSGGSEKTKIFVSPEVQIFIEKSYLFIWSLITVKTKTQTEPSNGVTNGCQQKRQETSVGIHSSWVVWGSWKFPWMRPSSLTDPGAPYEMDHVYMDGSCPYSTPLALDHGSCYSYVAIVTVPFHLLSGSHWEIKELMLRGN